MRAPTPEALKAAVRQPSLGGRGSFLKGSPLRQGAWARATRHAAWVRCPFALRPFGAVISAPWRLRMERMEHIRGASVDGDQVDLDGIDGPLACHDHERGRKSLYGDFEMRTDRRQALSHERCYRPILSDGRKANVATEVVPSKVPGNSIAEFHVGGALEEVNRRDETRSEARTSSWDRRPGRDDRPDCARDPREARVAPRLAPVLATPDDDRPEGRRPAGSLEEARPSTSRKSPPTPKKSGALRSILSDSNTTLRRCQGVVAGPARRGSQVRKRLARSIQVGILRSSRRGTSPSRRKAGRRPRSIATMPQLSRIDRVRGCLLGLAVGDALGAPLEGLTAQQIKTHYGRVKNYVDGVQAWKRKPYRWRMRGLYSDDTQQALALADVLLECGHADQGRLAAIYVAMAEAKGTFLGVHRGIGRSFRQVLAELQRGVSPRWSGQMKAGIGAAMRIAPVGLFFEDDPDGFFRAVMESSVTTHRDVRSLSGAMAVAHGVRRLIAGEPRDPSLLLWLASDVARDEARMSTEGYGEVVISLEPHARAMSKALAHAETLLETPRERALPALAEEANRHGAEPDCKRPTMGFPPACIPTCLYVLLTTDSFEEAIQEVVNLGGDADTTG
ncbi:hypothetical protein HK102_008265, partial [Quaeritorhiza haematococci]